MYFVHALVHLVHCA